ncbi:MAG: outer membrane lipoprotein chaperone LolA, partial [Marinobacter sp.]
MIKTGRIVLGTLALLLLAGLVRADDQAADRLAESLSSYSTFQANFTQTVADEQGRVRQESTGNLKAKRPGLFYWETDPPANQFIVSNGDTVELYDPDLEQVTVQALDEQVSTTPALLLSGEVEDLSDTYEIT